MQTRSKDPGFAARVQLTRQASELGRRAAWAEVEVSRIRLSPNRIEAIETELESLFSFRKASGILTKPLVWSSSYTTGYVQFLRAQWDFIQAEAVVSSGRLLFYQDGRGTEGDLRKSGAKEVGSIQNAVDVFNLGGGC
ncbi:hypothetical protein AK812_SmicGene11624 [Symbiodinium microadriaticum]|uniref:Uncharacterized protein n=1 Tax=Symbiodinium microadriaticum TaxID=2951 RepID=A0A1Q9ECW3_SYMMI|nr:hypothetical protein AK812_SmicGene11624 [Symbiodinium microadriaticum]